MRVPLRQQKDVTHAIGAPAVEAAHATALRINAMVLFPILKHEVEAPRDVIKHVLRERAGRAGMEDECGMHCPRKKNIDHSL